LIGSYSLLAFAAFAVIVAFIVLCHAEVASRFRSTGGAYLYAKTAFGPVVAFEVGWLYWIVRTMTFAANSNLFVTYLGYFVPSASDPFVRIAILTAIVIVLAGVNVIGVRQSAVLTNIFTIGKLAPLMMFIVVGLFFIRPENFTFDAVPAYAPFSTAVMLLIYAFVGFEVAVVPAGEAKDPRKDYPFALLTALAVVAIFYILIQVVSIGTLPTLATADRPLAEAARAFMGPIGAAIVAAGALVSILGNLNVGVFASSRILFALAEKKDLPEPLAAIHTSFRTPYVAIILNALIIFFLAVQASFLTAVAMATITRLLVYATTCFSLIVFRRRTDMTPEPYLAPFGVGAAVISIALIVWLLTNVDFKKEGLPIIIFAAVGLVIYAANKLFHRRTASA
jgi:amino acid transporter